MITRLKDDIYKPKANISAFINEILPEPSNYVIATKHPK